MQIFLIADFSLRNPRRKSARLMPLTYVYRVRQGWRIAGDRER